MDCNQAIAEYNQAIDEARDQRAILHGACDNLRLWMLLLYVATAIFIATYLAWVFCWDGWFCFLVFLVMLGAAGGLGSALYFVFRSWDAVKIERDGCRSKAGRIQQKWGLVFRYCDKDERPQRVWVDCDCP